MFLLYGLNMYQSTFFRCYNSKENVNKPENQPIDGRPEVRCRRSRRSGRSKSGQSRRSGRYGRSHGSLGSRASRVCGNIILLFSFLPHYLFISIPPFFPVFRCLAVLLSSILSIFFLFKFYISHSTLK